MRRLLVLLAVIYPVAVNSAAAAAAAAAFLPDASEFNLGDAVRGFPGMIKSNLRQLKAGTSLMWKNGKEAKAVRLRVPHRFQLGEVGCGLYAMGMLMDFWRAGGSTVAPSLPPLAPRV